MNMVLWRESIQSGVACVLFSYVLSDDLVRLPLPGDPNLWALLVAYSCTYLACVAFRASSLSLGRHSPRCREITCVAAVAGSIWHCGYSYGLLTLCVAVLLPNYCLWFPEPHARGNVSGSLATNGPGRQRGIGGRERRGYGVGRMQQYADAKVAEMQKSLSKISSCDLRNLSCRLVIETFWIFNCVFVCVFGLLNVFAICVM